MKNSLKIKQAAYEVKDLGTSLRSREISCRKYFDKGT
jgi:hypothetical protein